MTDLFGSIPDNVEVDDDLYGEEYKSYPIVTWHGQSGPGKEAGGFWTIKADDLNGQEPGPKGFWELIDMKFGKDPNNPMESVWKTQRLRCVGIAPRRRNVITTDDDREHYFPAGTSRKKRGGIEGKFSEWYQVLVEIPDLDQLCVLALRGYARTKSWDNWNKAPGFPAGGVEPQLIALSKKANKARNMNIHWECFWVFDLTPAYQDEKPYWVQVHADTYMNPFTLDMTVSDDPTSGYPDNRFVGKDNFRRLQDIRREIGMDWMAQWEIVSEGGDTAYDYSNGADEETAPPITEDEIPF